MVESVAALIQAMSKMSILQIMEYTSTTSEVKVLQLCLDQMTQQIAIIRRSPKDLEIGASFKLHKVQASDRVEGGTTFKHADKQAQILAE